MAILRVGLTGGLASGKSTVARRLADAGFAVIDADRLVAELYEPGGAGLKAVAEIVGPETLQPDGRLDKVKVARHIFRDDEARQRLEAAIHPLVRRRFAELASATPGVAVLEASKLVEAGYAPDFDLVVTVEAPTEERIRRAVARGLSAEDARARIAAQAGEGTRRQAAHVVIENDEGHAELNRACERLAETIRRRAVARQARS